jgi:hypothetical protein|tara:strand:+ start:572 stop:748 length:177 start_codon:yes stop_codon:yes gene_type:complete
MKDEYITIRALIRSLERRAKVKGDDSLITIDGFDPCKIEVIDNHDYELYEDVETLISG